MRALRWLALIPASSAAFCLAVSATIAIHYLVEQHLCPAADFDRGICNNRPLGMALEVIKHGGTALTVVIVASVTVIVAPSHKRELLWVTLALLLLLAAWFGYAASAESLFVAALGGGMLAAIAIPRHLRTDAPVA